MPIMPRNDTWEGATAQRAGAYALYALASPVVGLLRIGVSGYYLLKQLYVNDLKPKFNKAHREAMNHLNEGTLPGHEKPGGGGALATVTGWINAQAFDGKDKAEGKARKTGKWVTGTNTHKGWKQEFKRGLIELTLIGGIAYAILEIRDNKKPEEFVGVNKVVDLVTKEVTWSQGVNEAKSTLSKATGALASVFAGEKSSSESDGEKKPTAAAAVRNYRDKTAEVRARQAARQAKAKKD